jgi:hypothetical protein
MGLETERIGGQAKDITHVASEPVADRERHTWVAVRIKGQWQLVDATWGAGHVQDKRFVKRFNEYYFFPAPDQLLFTHLPNEPKWQLVKTPLSAEEFQRCPRVDRSLFELGVSVEAVKSAIAEPGFRELVQVYTHPSTTTFIVKAPLTKHLVADADYEFELKSGDYVDMAIFFNDKTPIPMKPNGSVFTLTVKAKKGTVSVCGRKSKNDQSFPKVLGYVVD